MCVKSRQATEALTVYGGQRDSVGEPLEVDDFYNFFHRHILSLF